MIKHMERMYKGDKAKLKAAIYTLGCKVNQNESAAMEELLRKEGYEVVRAQEEADVYIVNSCTVTAEGAAKSRRWLRSAKRRNPQAITVMCGCFPQALPKDALMFEADVITGTAGRSRLPQQITKFLQTQKQVLDIIPQSKLYEHLPPARAVGKTRGFLKVQDGCNRRCAYCLIPQARGPSRSRSEEDILKEASLLAKDGVREMVLTGINLPSYGKDTGTNLAALSERLSEIEGILRIRLSSLDPDLLSLEHIERFSKLPKLCPHFHLSLQSGCKDTLRRMRRPYTPQQYREVADALRLAFPTVELTTDVIVGFAGETEDEFLQSLQFVKEMKFLKVHVFPYSVRPGTAAAEFSNQVPKTEKEQRAKQLQTAADEVRARLLQDRVGSMAQVLLETPLEDGFFSGYTEHYLPVRCEAPDAKQGDIVTVRLGALCGERLQAERL